MPPKPSTIVLLMLMCVAVVSARPDALQPADTIGDVEKRQIVESLGRALHSTYVFPDVGNRMIAEVMRRLSGGMYDSILDAKVFAETLTHDLRSVYADLHLSVHYGPPPTGAGGSRATAVSRVEVLEGNVGYLKLDRFFEYENDAAAAMRTFAATDALIVDIRDNTGGAAPTFLAGYFFEKPTLIAHVISQPGSITSEMWTQSVPNPLYLSKPVYIVTSGRTFSAAEAFAYHLKHFKKAMVVGENTGGGGHRVMGVSVGRSFVLMIPFARPVNVITGSNWEGTGVVPDVVAPSEIAVAAAHLEALRRLPANAAREEAIARLSREVKR